MCKRIILAGLIISFLLLTSCGVAPMEKPSGGTAAGEATASTASQGESQEQSGDPTTPMDPVRTEKYTVYWEDGKCYLKLSDESLSQAGESGTQNLISIPYPKFSSVAEMKKKLESGDLTDSEIAALMFKAKDQAKGVELVYNRIVRRREWRILFQRYWSL